MLWFWYSDLPNCRNMTLKNDRYQDAYGNYPDLTKVRKVLVIKLRHLGDVLLTAPVFSALKKALPHAKIDAFIWSECVPMLEGHPSVDGWIEYDRSWKKLRLKRLFKEVFLLRKIRSQNYDLVINLTEGDRGALAAKISKAPIRVGFDPKKKGFWGKKGLYTHVVKACPGLRHTVERNLDALRALGIFPKLEERELFLHVPESAVSTVKKLTSSDSFILIHPASRWRFKCWPVEKMRELTQELLAKGEKLVFSSGPDPMEKAMVDEIVKGFPVLNLAGKVSLKELGALIQLAKTLISVDSAPLHMASALKIPTVAIFGPTSDVTWGPWKNPKARIVAQPFSCRPCYQDGCGGSKVSDCLHSLPVSKVIEVYESLQEELCLSC